jgi:hypothetical protein
MLHACSVCRGKHQPTRVDMGRLPVVLPATFVTCNMNDQNVEMATLRGLEDVTSACNNEIAK